MKKIFKNKLISPEHLSSLKARVIAIQANMTHPYYKDINSPNNSSEVLDFLKLAYQDDTENEIDFLNYKNIEPDYQLIEELTALYSKKCDYLAEVIDRTLSNNMHKNKVDKLLLAIINIALSELILKGSEDKKIIINEYIEITRLFHLHKKNIKFANAMIDNAYKAILSDKETSKKEVKLNESSDILIEDSDSDYSTISIGGNISIEEPHDDDTISIEIASPKKDSKILPPKDSIVDSTENPEVDFKEGSAEDPVEQNLKEPTSSKASDNLKKD